MLTTRTDRRRLPGTEIMRGAPEAFSQLGEASEASLERSVLAAAACAGAVDLGWVPDVEDVLVPEPLRRLCSSCPGRAACLQTATSSGSDGYWAGTTTDDRGRMAASGSVSVARADQLQAALREKTRREAAHDQAAALHPAGQDSLWWYRRGGCRCRLCRGHNAQRRGEERARTRSRREAGRPVSSAA